MKMMKHPIKRTCWSSMTTRQNQHEKSSRKGKKKTANQTYNEENSQCNQIGFETRNIKLK